MNRDDIIRLAKEVDAEISAFIDYHYDQEMVVFSKGQLERFAALVAAAEREGCAREVYKVLRTIQVADQAATVIRARGNK